MKYLYTGAIVGLVGWVAYLHILTDYLQGHVRRQYRVLADHHARLRAVEPGVNLLLEERTKRKLQETATLKAQLEAAVRQTRALPVARPKPRVAK